MEVRVRIAPSPTGVPHIGNTRTALYNYLFAKKNRGTFIVRIEDTDKKRSVSGSMEKILEILKFLNLNLDEGPGQNGRFGPYIQSARLPIYQKMARRLIDTGKAYYCFCRQERINDLRIEQRRHQEIPHYDRHCLRLTSSEIDQHLKNKEKYVIRLKVPKDRSIYLNDLVQGKVKFDSNIIDDQVLIKSDGFPTYHLAATVDDYLMKISHVIRGVEWLSSSPKHLLLYEAFGWQPPVFAHLPIILGPDKSKLSKRHGAKSALDYQAEGYLPEAIVNFMAFLGWSYKDNSDLLSMRDLIKLFTLTKVRRANPIFDLAKLDWFNSQWIKKLSDKELLSRMKPFLKINISDQTLLRLLPAIKNRIQRLTQLPEMLNFISISTGANKNLFNSQAKVWLSEIAKVLKLINNWQAQEIYMTLKKLIEQKGYTKKEFYVNLYLAIEGKENGLPVFDCMEVLGKTEVLRRINQVKLAL